MRSGYTQLPCLFPSSPRAGAGLSAGVGRREAAVKPSRRPPPGAVRALRYYRSCTKPELSHRTGTPAQKACGQTRTGAAAPPGPGRPRSHGPDYTGAGAVAGAATGAAVSQSMVQDTQQIYDFYYNNCIAAHRRRR